MLYDDICYIMYKIFPSLLNNLILPKIASILCEEGRSSVVHTYIYICNKFIKYVKNMTEARTRDRKGRRIRGKPSNKVEKVDSPVTRTRVIACPGQISDPWLCYGWFIRRGMHRSGILSPSSSGTWARGLNMCKNRQEQRVKVSRAEGL